MTHQRLTITTLAVSIAAMWMAATVHTATQVQFAALPLQPPSPVDNPTTPEKVALGRLLFWDPILSGSKDVACATCHHPSLGYADGLDVSIGVNGVGLGTARHFSPDQPSRFVKRNSQTVLNTAFNGLSRTDGADPAAAPMFWDSRVRSLESQALEPIKALEEMRGDGAESHEAIDQAVARVAAVGEYRRLFATAFGTSAAVTGPNIARAIAAFERTLVATNAPFDRYMRGDTTAMTAQQVRGMTTFQTMGCANCHSGPMFSDYKSHVLGVPENRKLPAPDAGADNRYAFRTPSLRNLAFTAPYMHNGTLTSLDAVVNFYNQVGGGRGGRRGPQDLQGPQGPQRNGGPPGQQAQGGGGRGRGGRGGTQNPNVARQALDPLLRQVNVRGGRQDVIAFLGALNDDGFDKTIPTKVPSGLKPGGKVP